MSDIRPVQSRRQFLAEHALGIGTVALSWLLNEEQLLATPKNIPKTRPNYDLSPKQPHFNPQATAMISLFQHGGPSHMDLTDPKPELSRFNGTDCADDIVYSGVAHASRKLFGSPWRFRPHGQCGTELSELLPYTAEIVDEICLIRGMHTGSNTHNNNLRYFHGGVPAVAGRPNLGSWLLYGLGSETQDLPAYMVMTAGGTPVDGVLNWSHGFMPALYQGTVLRPKEPRILNLHAPQHLRGTLQQQNLDLLSQLNREHLKQFSGSSDLEARIASFELAARMQTAAVEALDVSKETASVYQLYGLDDETTRDYGTRCLIARRLVERGVRFVQLFHDTQPWDNHQEITTKLPAMCRKTDKPVAALVKDLKQRGMLDTTIVHWGGEIGRLPVVEDHGSAMKSGRDHNGQGFSIWLAGGGIKPGITYGKTDDVGHRAVENIVTPNDYQATLLHLFGLDWRKLVYHHNGREEIITNHRPARVVADIITNGPPEDITA